MKTPGTLYRTTHEYLDDVGCYCYPRFDKNNRANSKDPYVPVGAILMYVKSNLHKSFFEDEDGEMQYDDIWFDTYLFGDKFVEFDPEDEVVIPLEDNYFQCHIHDEEI